VPYVLIGRFKNITAEEEFFEPAVFRIHQARQEEKKKKKKKEV
jgi:hypothetical protein